MRRARGASVHVILVVGLLVLVLLATVQVASTWQLAFSTRRLNAEAARSAAEAVLALGVSRVLEDPTLGAEGRPAPAPLAEVAGQEGGPEAIGTLGFVAAGNQPYSTNNLDSDVPVTGWQAAVVPPRMARLVGVGECRGERRAVEAVLYIPRYPYAVSSSGPMLATGGLLVTGVQQSADVAADGTVAPERRIRIQVAGNAPDGAAPGIRLGAGTRITGDVLGVGTVELEPGADVQGEVRSGERPAPLAKVRIEDYDPADRPGCEQLPLEEYVATGGTPVKLRGLVRREGDLRIVGDLDLDRGIVYVHGNLEVQGAVQGRGALMVTGTTHLSGGGKLDAHNEAALLSKGDVNIEGRGASASTFRGLVYTEGDFTAENITLVGVFAANGSTAGKGAVTLRNANAVYVPGVAEFTLEPLVGLSVDRGKSAGIRNLAWTFESRALLADFDRGADTPAEQDRYDVSRVALAVAKMEYIYRGRNVTRSQFLSLAKRSEDLPPPETRSPACDSATTWDAYLACEEEQILEGIRQQLAQANREWREYRENAVWAQNFTVDLNRFIAVSDRIRLRLWRDLDLN